ncbi:MAG: glycosyltransferase [Rhizobium sp.]|nr:glycosyltransferase [Rhizobium sp.]
MSSEPFQSNGPVREGAILCRIGDRAVLAPQLSERFAESVLKQAIRRLDIAAGTTGFHLYQMPIGYGFDPSGENICDDVISFIAQSNLSDSDRAHLLVSLFGTAARLLAMQSDEVFNAFARQLQLNATARAVIQLHEIGNSETVLAVIPARTRMVAGDVLVSFADQGLTIGRVEGVEEYLARPNPRQKIAAIDLSAPVHTVSALLIGRGGEIALKVNTKPYADTKTFIDENIRDDIDLVALLSRVDSEAGSIVARSGRRDNRPATLDEPDLCIRFVTDVAVSLDNGLFVSGWFLDPGGEIDDVIAVDHTLVDSSISAVWKLFDGKAEIAGRVWSVKRYVALLRRKEKASPPAIFRIRVSLRNEGDHLIAAPPMPRDLSAQREAILETIVGHSFPPDMLTDIYLPALDPIQRQLNARQCVRHIREYGRRSSRSVSIIIPLYKEIGFIRSQLMALAVDAFVVSHCEIVFVLDDPLIAVGVASLLQGMTYAFGLDIKLVTLDRNGGYALANNIGVAQADGETLILLNSDVIPINRGWIEAALNKLGELPPFSVIGPKLLYGDTSLQHAGMYFDKLTTGYWQNFHYWKGYGRDFEPATNERVVPAVTGACMIIRKSDYLAVGGFTTDYIVGDYEDSDLCLKLRENQGTPYYMPSIELYHFERQSMPEDDGQQDRGSTSYNRALHTAKWDMHISNMNLQKMDAGHAK